MATALARGFAEPALAYDVDPERARALAEAVRGEAVESAGELARRADVVVLAHKPAHLEEAAVEVAGTAKAVVSIVAATPVASRARTSIAIVRRCRRAIRSLVSRSMRPLEASEVGKWPGRTLPPRTAPL